jgi:biotin-(acetyl-CoA carboxylase) ligase
MPIEKLLKEAADLEENYKSFKSRNEKIIASKKAKELVLGINEVYKETKDTELMDLMKKITEIKIKLEKRLKGRLTS